MPINDILTQIDFNPGLSDGNRQDVASRQRDGNNSTSEYRRALSRTLSRDDRREQTAPTRTEVADARQPPPPSDSRRSQPSDEAIPVRANSESRGPSPQPDAGEANATTLNDHDDSNRIQNNPNGEQITPTESTSVELEAEPPSQFNEPSVTDFLIGVDEPPSPPANLSLLFASLSEDEVPAADSDPLNEISLDDTPLLPPVGLFNAQERSGEQQGNPATLPPNPESSAIASTPENAHVDVATLHPQQAGIGDFVQAVDVELSERPAGTPSGNNVERDTVIDFGSINTNANLESATASDSVASGQIARESAADPSLSSAMTAQELAPDAAVNLSTSATIMGNSGNPSLELRRDEPVSSSETAEPSRGTGATAIPSRISTGRNVELAETTPLVQTTDLEPLPEPTGGNDSSKSSVSPSGGQISPMPITARESQSVAATDGLLPTNAEQFVERVASAVRSAPQNGQQLRVRLYPPHLGSIQIEVTSNNGTLSVRMEVQSVAAHTALSDNMSALREALVQQGNSLDRIDVQLVETSAEEGRADLTDEQPQQQQQAEEQVSQDAEEQVSQDAEEQPAEVETEDDRVTIQTGNGIDELDIQV